MIAEAVGIEERVAFLAAEAVFVPGFPNSLDLRLALTRFEVK